MILRAENLSVGYTKPILQNVNFAIENPCLIGVVGTNGAGKSTLLKTLCGLTSALSGSIFVNEKNINTFSVQSLSEQVTYLPGAKTFHADLTVKELLFLAEDINDFAFYKTPELTENQRAILQMLSIADLENKALNKLSDGQYQLTSVAFSLCRNTPILLLDEPLAFLDFRNRKLLMNHLSELPKKRQKTVLFSTHDLNVLSHCDSVWHIENETMNVIENDSIVNFVKQLSE
ncbi:MAG TPA: ABC transporter ATP-binding protein [Chitinophagales bacterium]